MHPYVLIPLLACLVASIMVSAILARDASARVSWVAAAMLGCAGLWGFTDFLSNLAAGPETALPVMRAAGFAYLPIGPLSLQLLLELRPDAKPRFRGLLVFAWGMTAALAVAHFATPYFVSRAVPTDWGFTERFGPAFPLGIIHVISYCGASVVALARNSGDSMAAVVQDRRLALAIALPLAVATITDVVMPCLELDGPRLGSLVSALLGGSIWLLSFRWSRFTLNPSAFARQVLDNLDDGVALLGSSGRIRAVNRSLASLIGLAERELIGRSVALMLPEVQGGFGDQERERETVLRLASGQSVPVSISISIIRDRQGAMMGHALVVRDQREVTKLRHHIVISGRLAAAGEMAAGIAHEVNNPMAFIQANLNLLYRHLDEIDAQLAKELPEASLSPALDVGRERIEEALEDIAQVASIVREVRDFAHAGSGGGQIEDVNQLADSAVRLARLQLGERVQVRRDYGELPLIPCVGQDLKQLFLGLVLNAGRAVGESGTIRFTTELRADHIAVLVEDDGCGIAPKTLERVLDPSFESSALDEGTNLELAIANQIACRHGGSMSIESESELGSRQGTRVTICLPVASESQCTSSY